MHGTLLVKLLAAFAAVQDGAVLPDKLEEVRIKTAHPLRPGELEVNGQVDWLRFDEGRESAILGKLSYGITEWLTGEAILPLVEDAPSGETAHSGLGNISLEAKASLARELLPFRLAMGVRAGLVTSDPEHQVGTAMNRLGMIAAGATSDFKVYLAASGAIADGLNVHVQPWTDFARARRTIFGLGSALEIQPGGGLSFLFGLDGSFGSGHSALWSVVPGVSYRWLEPRVKIGIGIPVGLGHSSESEDVGIIVDFEVRF